MAIKYHTNMKIEDIDKWERKEAILDKDNNVLCPVCKKNQANITEYGMIRTCDNCKREEYNVIVSIDEPSGRRSY